MKLTVEECKIKMEVTIKGTKKMMKDNFVKTSKKKVVIY